MTERSFAEGRSSAARCVKLGRAWYLPLLILAGLAFTVPALAKTKPHPLICHRGFVRRTVRVAQRKHGRIVRSHGKIVYRRVQKCVKVRKRKPASARRPATTANPTSVPATPAPATHPTAPADLGAPQVSGTTRSGQSLAAVPGTWTGTPSPTFAYQWSRCDGAGGSCSNVAGAVSSIYNLGAADVGSRLRVLVTAANGWGSASAMSATTDVIGLASDPSLVAVGDIACPAGDTANSCQQQATASLAKSQNPNSVSVLGDNQYNSGLFSEYEGAGAYNATWGQFNPIVHPIPGNHEYTASSAAAGYFQYFGQGLANPANTPAGYYSFNLGTWHVDALNSDCTSSGCTDSVAGATSTAQVQWLQGDLAANRSECTLAMWHHPLFSSGFVGDSPGVAPLWTALYNAHADIVLGGHDHLYERYAQQDSNGNPTSNGIREFVVGTGGENLNGLAGAREPNLQVYDDSDFGVLKLTLHASSYDWAFINTSGKVIDSASTACHGAGAASASTAAVRSAARDIALAAVPARIGRDARLVFAARPLTSSLRTVARHGLPLAVHCSRKCDVRVRVSLRRGRHLEQIATFLETDKQIPVAYDRILLRLPARRLERLRTATLVLRFDTRDAANHHGVVTRTVRLR